MASIPVSLDPTALTPAVSQPQPTPPPVPAIPARPGGDVDTISDFLKNRLSSSVQPAQSTAPGAPTPPPAVSTPATVDAPVSSTTPAITEEDLREFNFDDTGDSAKPGLIPPVAPVTPEASQAPAPASTTPDEATTRLAQTLAEGGLPKEVESAFLSTNRGRRMLETFKVMRELESPPDPSSPNAGGIGFVPNADQIRSFYQAHSWWESLQDEFDNNPGSFVHNFFAPDPQTGQFRPGVPAIAQTFLQSLEHYDPQGRLAQAAIAPVLDRPYIQVPVLQAQLNDLRSLAESVPAGQNPDQFGVDERSRILDAANILQSRLQARFSRNGSPAALTTPTTRGGPADPLAAERAALAAERQRLAQANQSIETNLVSGFRNEVMGVLESTVQKDVDAILARGGVKQKLESISPSQYTLYRDACVQEVYKNIAGSPAEGLPPSNPTALQSFNVSLNRATRSVVQTRQPIVPGSEGDRARAHAIQQYRQIGQSVIRQLGTKFIKGAGGQIEASNPSSSTLARLAMAGGQMESPANSGPPVQHSLAPAVELPKVQPGQDPAEVFSNYFANKLKASVR